MDATCIPDSLVTIHIYRYTFIQQKSNGPLWKSMSDRDERQKVCVPSSISGQYIVDPTTLLLESSANKLVQDSDSRRFAPSVIAIRSWVIVTLVSLPELSCGSMR